jgi:hypothetical protein
MTTETIRDFLNAAPFVPFTVHLADGRAFTIDHPDFTAFSRDERELILILPTGSWVWIDIGLILRIEAAKPEHA